MSNTLPAIHVSPLARWATHLLIATSVGTMIGRIMAVTADTGETPMLSANDRSRWCTVRVLVEQGTYVIDDVVKLQHPETKRRFWNTIDKVRHRGHDGREHFYSSKPPLFPTLLAGQYWAVRNLLGWNLGDHPFAVMRLMLVLTNVLPLVLYFYVLLWMVNRLAASELSRLFVMAAATSGTFLTTFSVTLNNHLVAAISVAIATGLTWEIWQGRRRYRQFFGAGLFAAFAAANELPALLFLAVMALAAVWKSPRHALAAFAPAAALVGAGFFGTNYLAHGTWTMPYAHRKDGAVVATLPPSMADALNARYVHATLPEALQTAGIRLSDQTAVLVYQQGTRWGLWDRASHTRLAVVRSGDVLEVRSWNNWYDYEGSYWQGREQGVDRGERSRLVYIAHVLVGHHGIFSLTPIWLLSLAGAASLLRGTRPGWRAFGWMVPGVTLVCLAFYVSRPPADLNYGGVSCGFRWMFWLSPLWLLCLAPAADRMLERPAGRIAAVLVLAISVFSATYAAENPWSHPWLFDLGSSAGWWRY